jgi:hypothetical protein
MGEKKEIVFVSVFNYGCIDLALNLLQSIRNNSFEKHHICYVTDNESYYLIKKQNYNVELFSSLSFNKDKNDFDSIEFNNISYARYYVLKELASKYNNMWYIDTDIVILSNLYDYYINQIKNKNIKYDLIFQNDINMRCTGCFLMRTSDKTLKWIENMIENKRNIGDQIILREIIQRGLLDGYTVRLFLNHKFPNGLLYFAELNDNPHMRQHQIEYRNRPNRGSEAMLVHANYMIGIDTKIEAFKKHNLWFI